MQVERVGIDYVGIGSDFNHGGGVAGFANTSEALNVTVGLIRRGYSKDQIGKIWDNNFRKVFFRKPSASESKLITVRDFGPRLAIIVRTNWPAGDWSHSSSARSNWIFYQKSSCWLRRQVLPLTRKQSLQSQPQNPNLLRRDNQLAPIPGTKSKTPPS